MRLSNLMRIVKLVDGIRRMNESAIPTFTRNGKEGSTGFTSTILEGPLGYYLKSIQYHGFPAIEEKNAPRFIFLADAFDDADMLTRSEIGGRA
jgi:hypothetical protein